MKFKRLLSFFAAAAVAATTITIPAAADSAAAPTVLFSDDFDSGYTNGIFERHTSGDNYTNLIGRDFKVANAIGIKNTNDYFYPTTMEKSGDADKVFVLNDDSGVGSGKSLNVTTQAGLNSCSWMIKNSGITSESIGGKELTFTVNFMIPNYNGFNWGNGVIVYLDEKGTDHNMPTTRWSFGVGTDWAYISDNLKSKTLLCIESEQYAKTPCAFAFGEKLADIEVGKTYSYKLILTPNGDGGYTAKAKINGVIHELSGANLPKVEKMARYQFAMIAEKANPYFINANYSSDNKYQNDKTIALLDNLCFTASEPAPESDTLFSDDFSGYTEEYIAKAEQNKLEYYDTNSFIVRNNVASGQWTAKINGVDTVVVPRSEHPERIAKLADGVFGSPKGKSLQLTSQGLVVNGSMYKRSNVTETKIDGKALVFSAKFMIPSEGMYNRGVGFAAGLSPANSDGTAPDAVCTDVNHQISENYLKNKYKLFSAQGTKFSVFGKEIDNLEIGTEYNFTLKMIPDENNSEYRVFANLNDYEVEVFSNDTPTVNEMKVFKYAYIALHNHGYFTYANSEKNADGTSKYASDKPLVYMDDIKLESKEKNEVIVPDAAGEKEYRLFGDDFSDYNQEQKYILQAQTDTIDEYKSDYFVLAKNAQSIKSDQESFPGCVSAGSVERAAKVSKISGFGDGNSLQLQSQGILYNASMWKNSNITYERIKGQTLVFKTEFMIPSNGEWNNGTVAAIAFGGKSENSQNQPDSMLVSSDFLLKNINSENMLAGIGVCDDYRRRLLVFGENVSELENDKNYSLTVTMTPKDNAGYTVNVKLNDDLKTLDGTGAPTQEEVGNYSYAAIINHSNRWNTSSSYTADNPYPNDKDLIYFDNISLDIEPTYFVSVNGDNSNDGSAEAPFKTVKRALSMARNGGNMTVIAKNDITVENMPELQKGRITIAGTSSGVKIRLAENFECSSNVRLDNLTIDGNNIFANGHNLELTDKVMSLERLTVYGGGNGKNLVGDTKVNLYGGMYNRVYGGGYSAITDGNTYVVFGGNCNTGDGIDDGKSNISPCYVFGGGNGAAVSGKTNITLSGDAVAKYIVGSGEGSLGTVGVSTNINVTGGKVMNVYGGSSGSAPVLSCDTNVIITGGVAEALFGGSEGTNLNGNTKVCLFGGEVTRRVFSGCYNGTSGWLFISFNSSNHVNGFTSVVLTDSAKLATLASSFANAGVFAGSRLGSRNSNETNSLVFLDNCYESKKSVIGDKSGWSSTFKSFETYTVKSGEGGAAGFVGKGVLEVKPDCGMAASINGKTYENEKVNISEGVTEVKFIKNFTIDSVTKDKKNGRITVCYTFNNCFAKPNPMLYSAFYKKLPDGKLELLNVKTGAGPGENILTVEIKDNIVENETYIIKEFFLDEKLTPLTYVYEKVY